MLSLNYRLHFEYISKRRKSVGLKKQDVDIGLIFLLPSNRSAGLFICIWRGERGPPYMSIHYRPSFFYLFNCRCRDVKYAENSHAFISIPNHYLIWWYLYRKKGYIDFGRIFFCVSIFLWIHFGGFLFFRHKKEANWTRLRLTPCCILLIFCFFFYSIDYIAPDNLLILLNYLLVNYILDIVTFLSECGDDDLVNLKQYK